MSWTWNWAQKVGVHVCLCSTYMPGLHAFFLHLQICLSDVADLNMAVLSGRPSEANRMKWIPFAEKDELLFLDHTKWLQNAFKVTIWPVAMCIDRPVIWINVFKHLVSLENVNREFFFSGNSINADGCPREWSFLKELLILVQLLPRFFFSFCTFWDLVRKLIIFSAQKCTNVPFGLWIPDIYGNIRLVMVTLIISLHSKI